MFVYVCIRIGHLSVSVSVLPLCWFVHVDCMDDGNLLICLSLASLTVFIIVMTARRTDLAQE